MMQALLMTSICWLSLSPGVQFSWSFQPTCEPLPFQPCSASPLHCKKLPYSQFFTVGKEKGRRVGAD